jgi:hypothetical protein
MADDVDVGEVVLSCSNIRFEDANVVVEYRILDRYVCRIGMPHSRVRLGTLEQQRLI